MRWGLITRIRVAAVSYSTVRIFYNIFIHPPTDGHWDCFQFWCATSHAAVDILEYVSYCLWTRVTLLYRSASRVTGQSIKITSKATGSIYIPAYSRWTPLCPHPPQHLVMSDFRFANWMGVKWTLTVVFIPISLIINEVKHLLLHYELSRWCGLTPPRPCMCLSALSLLSAWLAPAHCSIPSSNCPSSSPRQD